MSSQKLSLKTILFPERGYWIVKTVRSPDGVRTTYHAGPGSREEVEAALKENFTADEHTTLEVKFFKKLPRP